MEQRSFDILVEGRDAEKIKPVEKVYKDNRAYEVFPQGWADIIVKYIWKKSKSECSFKFKKHIFYKTKGYPYFRFYGNCMEKNCRAPLKGTARN